MDKLGLGLGLGLGLARLLFQTEACEDMDGDEEAKEGSAENTDENPRQVLARTTSIRYQTRFNMRLYIKTTATASRRIQ